MLDQISPDRMSRPSTTPSQSSPSLASLESAISCDQTDRVNSLGQYDLAIVGGGIVGLTLACALQNSGLKIALIEAQERSAGLKQQRAYAITLMTGRILQGLELWDQIHPQITTFQQIRLADADCPSVVDLQPDDMGTAELGYVGEHCVLVKALLDRLEQAEHLTWFAPAQVVQVEYEADAATIAVEIDGQRGQLQTQVVVAADGSRSPLRQQVGIKTFGWQYWQSCVTAVIRPAQSHGNIAREHFWPSGPFATLPLPDNRCQIVLTAPHAEAKHWIEVDEAAFLQELDRRYGGQLGSLELISDRVLFPVRLMQSTQYAQPRLALVGDAAHCCHPVGGQGLNLGIRDAAALAQVLRSAHQRQENIGSLKVLRRYERWRKWENLTILGFTDFLDRCFSNQWLPIVVSRRLGLRLLQATRPLRFLALSLMTGLNGRQPEVATLKRSIVQE